MSDDDDGDEKANEGLTLPGNIDASYSINLTPLYLVSIGYIGNRDNPQTIIWRGVNKYLWSNNSRTNESNYYLASTDSIAYPSGHTTSFFAWSLRCLVSTNNKIMILHANQAQAYQFGER